VIKKNRETIGEQFSPPPNLPPGGSFKGRVMFKFRKIADLQVRSVLLHLAPWLAGLSGRVLEIGCGAQPYRHLIPEGCNYQGLDWEKSEEYFHYRTTDTVYYEGGQFPFADGTFDYLFHTEVLEHVYQKELFLSECKRILKPGGQMFFSIPFQARYHYIPFDYWRFTPASLEKLLTQAGFIEIEIICRGNDITVAAYKIVSLVYRWLQDGLRGIFLGLLFSPVWLIFLILGHISLVVNIGSRDDCLGYVVKARS
jgi:SAM-dependent methyltransferase